MPLTPSLLGFDHLLEQLTDLRETLMFTGLLYNKGHDEQRVPGTGASSHGVGVHHPSAHDVLTLPEAP